MYRWKKKKNGKQVDKTAACSLDLFHKEVQQWCSKTLDNKDGTFLQDQDVGTARPEGTPLDVESVSHPLAQVCRLK